MKKAITIVVLLGAIILSIFFIMFEGEKKVGHQKGMLAEDFTMPMYEKESGNLSDYAGDVIILNFWASWCEKCIREMPDLMQLAEDYQGDGLSVVTVNMQITERTLNDAPAFIEEIGLTLPVFFDEKGQLYDDYQLPGLPTSVLIDRGGIITDIFPGEVTYEGLEKAILPLLNEER